MEFLNEKLLAKIFFKVHSHRLTKPLCRITSSCEQFILTSSYLYLYPIGLSLVHFRREWVDGEVIQALAYDVPIPGYKTRNTISLRLWEAKACAEDFNLFQFNDGQYESSLQLHSRAQQVSFMISVTQTFVAVPKYHVV